MIRIERIEIEEFRGIRKLDLDLGKKNFGICGPNGTGKSGIVDAIEFALTGDITRLGGAGSAEVSVKAHAPHVDSSKTPEKCLVRITAYVPALNKTVLVERTVKAASTPKITPNETKTQDLIARLATHPEFALSRREIVKYIVTPAGERSKDVQTLLRLDQIEKVRLSLQRIANDAKKSALDKTSIDTRAKQDLLKHLGIQALSKAAFLGAVNERRSTLKLKPLADLTAETSVKEGVIPTDDKPAPKVRLLKTGALADALSYDEHVAAAETDAINHKRKDAAKIFEKVIGSPDALRSLKRKVLVEQGIELLEEDFCPLCDTAWGMDALLAHLQEKLATAADATVILNELVDAIEPLARNLEDIAGAARKIVKACALCEPPIHAAAIQAFALVCEKDFAALDKVSTDPSGITAALEVLNQKRWVPPKDTVEAATGFRKSVDSLPEASKEDSAKEFLIVAQERWGRCRETKIDAENAATRSATATKIFATYGTVSTKVLEGIYNAVQKDFTEYYSFINRDDEEKFEGKLTPSFGKLAFDVDFYGRGKFPPGAYHSEGHQDGMGLCLYLALMRHTLGDQFTLAVLDDVMMSIDAGHRREVCTLLKTKFPKTQFILTTHDPVWLQFMRTENLIQSSIGFGGWSVDSGPQVWKEGDVWAKISEQLEKNEVAAAAGTLRRYLEYVCTVLGDNFRSCIEYRANGYYDLGDLMPGVLQAWKGLLRTARDTAVSWGQDVGVFDAMEAEAKQRIAKSNTEQWMINKALHYNAWANLQKDEFAAVASTFRDLLKSMQCSNPVCAEFLTVAPQKGQREALRCGCGTTNLNLKGK